MPSWKDHVRKLLGDPTPSTTLVGATPSAPATKPQPQVRNADPTVQEAVRQLTLEPPRHPLDEQVEVMGETYHVKGLKQVYRERGLPITERGCTIDDATCILVPEPWNPHDANAVAVLVGEHHVGYLPGDLAATYASGLGQLARRGSLATGEARIRAKTDKGVVRGRVTILIPEAQAFR